MPKVKLINPFRPNFKWSSLLDPAHVKPKDLPEKAGIYAVVVCSDSGKPKCLLGGPRNGPLIGVVYVGMTGKNNTLKNRFYTLARSWRTKVKWKNPPHDSRTHYDNDRKAKRLFKVGDVRVRYMVLPSDPKAEHQSIVNLAKKLGLSVGEFRKILGLELTGDRQVANMEAINMQAIKKIAGCIPILNRDEEGKGDRPPTDAELKCLLDQT